MAGKQLNSSLFGQSPELLLSIEVAYSIVLKSLADPRQRSLIQHDIDMPAGVDDIEDTLIFRLQHESEMSVRVAWQINQQQAAIVPVIAHEEFVPVSFAWHELRFTDRPTSRRDVGRNQITQETVSNLSMGGLSLQSIERCHSIDEFDIREAS